jgi:hypothetical protein
MREIANTASRVAIDTHTKRRHTQRFARRLLKAALALLTTTGFAVWACIQGGWLAWFGVMVGILLMCYWSAQSVWHVVKALRLKPSAVEGQIVDSEAEPASEPIATAETNS